ncbi:MAG: aspartate--tRNA ligase [Bacillota bacterium]|nr:aspartate--tRNA ligase [Bacillota bacterium]
MGAFYLEARSKMCGEIRKEDIGKTYILKGWVAKRRNLGSLSFIDLRDKTGIVQLVVDEDASEALKNKAKDLGSEYVICAKGTIRERSSINPDIPTGTVELLLEDLHVYSAALTPPIHISDDDTASEQTRLQYRYLDLRKPFMQKNLKLRSDLVWSIRAYLNEHGFTDVETPMLAKSTPEGARDYLVPSRLHDKAFYALPQSPQLFKQLLMISSLDRYYQVAKCFRDEDLRADRQPEFTQIDMEMSFVGKDEVMHLAENMIKRAFKEVINYELPNEIPRMSYAEAMRDYGSDKPDRRFGMLLKDLSDVLSETGFNVFDGCVKDGGVIKGIAVENGVEQISKKYIKNLEKTAKKYGAKGMVWVNYKEDGIESSVDKFVSAELLKQACEQAGAKPGDMLLLVADKRQVVNSALGGLRLEIATKFDLIDRSVYDVLWIVDFPMFEYDEETDRYYAMHHPFTMPNPEDIDLIGKENGKVRAEAYDFVCNGYEMGGGSIRIHSEEIQKKVFNALGFTDEDIAGRFGFFVDALKYGTPPHGGIAFGLDRFVMLLANTDNIKDVIAFPKNQSAVCPMSQAPDLVDPSQLEELGITCVEPSV